MVGGTVSGIFRSILFVLSHKHDVVVRQALKYKAVTDALINDCKVNSSPVKILKYFIGGSTFIWEQKLLRLIRFSFYDGSWLNGTMSHNGFDSFYKAATFNFHKVIKSRIAADTLRPPHPFSIGNL